tara:strand:- start:191 stop:370 length:180 start_codon:yes stop_codon:yes gene_type:complete
MKGNLLSCHAQKPDKRASAACLAEFLAAIKDSLAAELAEIIFEGAIAAIELDGEILAFT